MKAVMAQNQIGQRLRQDGVYVLYGFVNSLLVIVGSVLAIATLILLGLTIFPGSLGETLRDMIPPGRVMQYLFIGLIGELLAMWVLGIIGAISRRTSLRWRWGLGIWVLLGIVVASILGAVV